MTPTDLPDRAPDAGHTVRAYVGAVWRRRWLVLLLAALGAAGGVWQGRRSPDVYGVATRIDIQKPKPFAGAMPAQAFGESYHESQLYYPTKWSLLSSRTYVDRLFASVGSAAGRRYPMWDWLTWPVYFAQRPPVDRKDSLGPPVLDALELEALVAIPTEEFHRRFSFRRYGAHPTPEGHFEDPSDLADFLANRVVVKPEKGTFLVSIELEGERREVLAPLLNLLIDVFWREQRSETQRRLERERVFWAKRRVELEGELLADDGDAVGDDLRSPRGQPLRAAAAAALVDWKAKNGSNAQRLELRAGYLRTQVVEAEAKLRGFDEDLVAARPDLEALLPDARTIEAAELAAVAEGPADVPEARRRAAAENRTDRRWLRGLDAVEGEAGRVAGPLGDSRFHALPFVTATADVVEARRRLQGYEKERATALIGPGREALAAVVRDTVLHRTRELRTLLGRRLVVRERMVADDDDLQQQWQLSEGLARLQSAVDGFTAQLTKVDTELDRIRSQISIENDARPLKVIEPATDPGRPVKPNRPILVVLGGVVGLIVGLAVALLLDWLDDTISDPDDVARHVGVPVVGSILTVPPKTADRISSEQPRSPVAEAFRAVRTSLEFAGPIDARGGRILLVSSCSPREGKTTVASNLAIVLAQDGKRTLLIDADLRKPRVHAVLGVDPARGLTNVVVGRERPEDVILPTSYENLWVLPAGVLPPNPAELLGRPAVKALLEAMRGSFDRIVIDTPPVGVVTDAAVLARLADTVLLVVAAGRTKKRAAEHAAALLKAVGAPPTGVLMNMVARGSRWAYGGYYDRGAREYYGSGPGAPQA